MQAVGDFAGHIEALTEAFIARTRQCLEHWRRSTEQPGVQDAAAGLIAELRSLYGSAASFGLAALGVAAAQWADQLEQGLPIEQWPPALAQLLALLAPVEPPVCPQLWQEAPATREAQRVLILSRDNTLAATLQAMLVNYGYPVRWQKDCGGAAQALHEEPAEVLIADADLIQGQQDVWDCVGQLARAAQHLLVIGAEDDFATRLRAVRLGAKGYFVKPVDLPSLEDTLQNSLSAQQREPFRVLIVEPDALLAQRYALTLSANQMRVECCSDARQVSGYLARHAPEVLLLATQLPECSGPELAQLIRFDEHGRRVPIVYLARERQISEQMNALLAEGDDFVVQPVSDSSLLTTVYFRAQRARLLSYALARDSLTGLLKHADIKEQLGRELERSKRSGKPLSVAMLDIDHFKKVNDQHGHLVGDQVIRALANLLRQRLRKADSLGRYGGEEFLLVLPECSSEQARGLIDELREHFSRLRFLAGTLRFHSTFSAGITSGQPNSTVESLIEQADRAMYQAKHAGRNRCLVFSEEA